MRQNRAYDDYSDFDGYADIRRETGLFAQVAVNVGLGLKPGQELVMTAGLETLPLARRITEQAYKAGPRW